MSQKPSSIVGGIREFMQLESAGGIVLLGAAVLALIVSNTPLALFYRMFLTMPVEIRIGALEIAKPMLLWINDGLMAVFFLLVGLEIKRELLEGELASFSQALLPAIGAIGGMIVPAAIYASLNSGSGDAIHGWAIPSATDIAFALGVLSLLGNRVPVSLKVFLLAVAIFDDLGAIVIIALFYSSELSLISLVLSAIVLAAMFAINRAGITRIAPYALLGIVLWVCVLKSGVHATLSGVAIALAIPIRARDGSSPLRDLEHMLHPWVAFLVTPLFGFANAGVSLTGIRFASLFENIAFGIAAGLFIGKQIGVLLSVFLCVKLRLARLPEGTGWLAIYGASLLAGIGFTMSLFIGTLAWDHTYYSAPLRIGVLGGSLLSGIAGYIVLRFATRNPAPILNA
ncbi:MAG TPA: Na+/H+ antiporter NhaA [Verrucomicrobiae bacterium]|nr:Na+/H+ antiporter NhaA [Verrucomicrobiae bacterium]